MSDSDISADRRTAGQLRPLRFQNHIAPHAAGSTLIEWGNTSVICGVTIEASVSRSMKEQEKEAVPTPGPNKTAARQKPWRRLDNRQ